MSPSALKVTIAQTGGSQKVLNMSAGSTIQEVLDDQGYGDLEAVTVNGVRTSDFDQEVEDGMLIFVTRSHKAGL